MITKQQTQDVHKPHRKNRCGYFYFIELSFATLVVALCLTSTPAAAAVGGEFKVTALDGTNGITVNGNGIIANDKFFGNGAGNSVSSAGDVNNDGIDDVIIGGQGLVGSGAYVIFGKSGGGWNVELELTDLDGTNGFKLVGGRTPVKIVTGAGDINNDGVSDIIVSTPNAFPEGKSLQGIAYVIFGKGGIGAGGVFDLGTLDGTIGFDDTKGFSVFGLNSGDQLGASVSMLGDVNGDTIDDFVIGAERVASGGVSGSGAAYVIFGNDSIGMGGMFPLASLNGLNGFVIEGNSVFGLLGRVVGRAGDVNGDGENDIIVGEPSPIFAKPMSYVIFGGDSVGGSGTITVSSLDGNNGFKITGAPMCCFRWNLNFPCLCIV